MRSLLPVERRATVLALFLATLIHGLMLMQAGGDTFVFAALGEEDTVTTAHIMDVVEDDTVLARRNLGHDGKFFLVQAWDPLYVTLDHYEHLDRPVYRGQRMFFPVIIGLGGLAPVASVPALLALTNIVAMTLGTLGTAKLCSRFGKNPMFGLAFLFNVGILSEISIGGAGIVAFALAVWGSLALEENRIGRAATLFMLSALTREVMLLFVAGASLLHMVRTRRLPILVAAPSLVGVAGWGAYLRLRLEAGTGIDEVREIGLPLVGAAEALVQWPDDGIGTVVFMALVLACLPWLVYRAAVDRNAFTWGSAGFVVLAAVLTVFVWREPFDITRAVIPVFTALAVSAAPRWVDPELNEVASPTDQASTPDVALEGAR